jgi:hypothetical protein
LALDFSIFVCLLFFETGAPWAAWAGLDLNIFLCQPP